MKAKIALTDPEAVELTVTLTMPLRDWKKLGIQLPQSHPSWRLTQVINALVDQASEHFENQPEIER